MKFVIVPRRDYCYWVESNRMDLIAAALQRHYHSPVVVVVVVVAAASGVVQMVSALVRWELQKDLLAVAAAVPQTRCCFVVGQKVMDWSLLLHY